MEVQFHCHVYFPNNNFEFLIFASVIKLRLGLKPKESTIEHRSFAVFRIQFLVSSRALVSFHETIWSICLFAWGRILLLFPRCRYLAVSVTRPRLVPGAAFVLENVVVFRSAGTPCLSPEP